MTSFLLGTNIGKKSTYLHQNIVQKALKRNSGMQQVVKDKYTFPSTQQDANALISIKRSSESALESINSSFSHEKLFTWIQLCAGVLPVHSFELMYRAGPIALNVPSKRDALTGVVLLHSLVAIMLHRSKSKVETSALHKWSSELEYTCASLFTASLLIHDEKQMKSKTTIPKFEDGVGHINSSETQSLKSSLLVPPSFLDFKLVSGLGIDEHELSERHSSEDYVMYLYRQLLEHRRESCVFFNMIDKLNVYENLSSITVIKIVEAVFDMTLGDLGVTRSILDSLLQGWNLQPQEPIYDVNAIPKITLSTFGSDITLGLSTLLRIATEAAFCSTDASLFCYRKFSEDEIILKKQQQKSPVISDLRSWPDDNLSSSTEIARSTCLTIVCSLVSLLTTCQTFRELLYQPCSTHQNWLSGFMDKRSIEKRSGKLVLWCYGVMV